jgi:hypothetical protein
LRSAHSVFINYALRITQYVARNTFLISWILQHMPFALPVDRLSETSTLLAFYHPHPAYTLHILLVPKKPIATLGALDPAADGAFLIDVYATAQGLIEQFHLAESGYRLIARRRAAANTRISPTCISTWSPIWRLKPGGHCSTEN